MKIIIDGTFEGKVQLLSFKTWPIWFARMGFKRFNKPFHKEAELEFGTADQIIKVPGPLDIIVAVVPMLGGYLVSAAIVEDNSKFVIFEVKEEVNTSWSGSFNTKILGNRVKGTILVLK